MNSFKGKPLLIVNTASKCGYTGQYEGLEALYKKHKDEGLTVIGFPSNSFNQETGSNAAIAKFCKFNFGVTFPLSRKVSVAGDSIDPVFRFLIDHAPQPTRGKPVSWNFEKFIIDRKGNVKHRFRSATSPEDPKFIAAIKEVINR